MLISKDTPKTMVNGFRTIADSIMSDGGRMERQ